MAQTSRRALIVGLLLSATLLFGQRSNPTSKLYIADLSGQSEIDTGERIEEIRNKSVHTAQGTIIETKEDSNNSMVFSNGTGVFLDNDTRMEIRRFSQEPFTPNRTDLETEPSISQTYNYVPRGRVGICAPRMVAGSSMVYATPHIAASIRGKKVVVETEGFETKISSVEGEVTLKGDSTGSSGRTLNDGQQAIITRLPGRPPEISIQSIPDDERPDIEDKVTMACNARRTVYFDAAKKVSENGPLESSDEVLNQPNPDDEGEEDVTPGSLDDLFLDEPTGSGDDDSEFVLVPVEVITVDPSEERTQSASRIVAPPGGG
ncbi:MAG: hypothetical protein SynsKO_45690 [Synoicihabitans sp.]